eukprot:TRINITY_DN81977_c0_g1_i1.p1 TRINITY_DN81977_c0_g1~~TRINITY_DN81977_c0_g1_i1.p1  ORF type:complete len:447 (+),score=60.86 TRINITY_DN81977_c0_g1_i1:103-1443(+)
MERRDSTAMNATGNFGTTALRAAGAVSQPNRRKSAASFQQSVKPAKKSPRSELLATNKHAFKPHSPRELAYNERILSLTNTHEVSDLSKLAYSGSVPNLPSMSSRSRADAGDEVLPSSEKRPKGVVDTNGNGFVRGHGGRRASGQGFGPDRSPRPGELPGSMPQKTFGETQGSAKFGASQHAFVDTQGGFGHSARHGSTKGLGATFRRSGGSGYEHSSARWRGQCAKNSTVEKSFPPPPRERTPQTPKRPQAAEVARSIRAEGIDSVDRQLRKMAEEDRSNRALRYSSESPILPKMQRWSSEPSLRSLGRSSCDEANADFRNSTNHRLRRLIDDVNLVHSELPQRHAKQLLCEHLDKAQSWHARQKEIMKMLDDLGGKQKEIDSGEKVKYLSVDDRRRPPPGSSNWDPEEAMKGALGPSCADLLRRHDARVNSRRTALLPAPTLHR